MGNTVGRIFPGLSGKQQNVGICMLGLESAGKTTILYKLRLGDIETRTPTIGFNVETVKYKNITFYSWDVGGSDRLRPLWKHYFDAAQGLIFVVDSSDRDRIDEAREELDRTLRLEQLATSKVLIVANKQDLPNAMSPGMVANCLGLRHSSNGAIAWLLGKLRWGEVGGETSSAAVDAAAPAVAPSGSVSLACQPSDGRRRLSSDLIRHIISFLDVPPPPVGNYGPPRAWPLQIYQEWHLQPCSLFPLDGIREGLEWLSKAMKGVKPASKPELKQTGPRMWVQVS